MTIIITLSRANGHTMVVQWTNEQKKPAIQTLAIGVHQPPHIYIAY